jgi:hypothetical protein
MAGLLDYFWVLSDPTYRAISIIINGIDGWTTDRIAPPKKDTELGNAK